MKYRLRTFVFEDPTRGVIDVKGQIIAVLDDKVNLTAGRTITVLIEQDRDADPEV